MRINKFIANSGVASRRKADEMILEGRVKVNGVVIKELGTQVDEKNDVVEVDGNIISTNDENKVYIMINKPEGYITTSKDQFGRKSVLDLVKDVNERVYPVGRLDYETSGLLLLTNDGDLTYKLTHPSHEFKKTYLASVKGIPTKEEVSRLENGLKIEDYITAKAKMKVVKINREKKYAVCMITIHEGKNRQVRKMLDAINHPVMNLRRVSLGKIQLGTLKLGEYRYLTDEEKKYLKNF